MKQLHLNNTTRTKWRRWYNIKYVPLSLKYSLNIIENFFKVVSSVCSTRQIFDRLKEASKRFSSKSSNSLCQHFSCLSSRFFSSFGRLRGKFTVLNIILFYNHNYIPCQHLHQLRHPWLLPQRQRDFSHPLHHNHP